MNRIVENEGSFVGGAGFRQRIQGKCGIHSRNHRRRAEELEEGSAEAALATGQAVGLALQGPS